MIQDKEHFKSRSNIYEKNMSLREDTILQSITEYEERLCALISTDLQNKSISWSNTGTHEKKKSFCLGWNNKSQTELSESARGRKLLCWHLSDGKYLFILIKYPPGHTSFTLRPVHPHIHRQVCHPEMTNGGSKKDFFLTIAGVWGLQTLTWQTIITALSTSLLFFAEYRAEKNPEYRWAPSITSTNSSETEGPALRSSVSPTNPEFSASQSTYLAIQSS